MSSPRRTQSPVRKLGEFRMARWFHSNGMPPTYIAARLGISRATLQRWVRLMDHDATVAALRRRVLALPEQQREQIVTAVVDARSAA